jgi:hypothetical protein
MKSLLLLLTLAFSLSSWAKKLEITAKISMYHEYEELDLAEIKKAGWSVKEDSNGEQVFMFQKIIPYSKLDIKKVAGPAYFSTAQNGTVEFGIVLGDSDSASITSIQLPLIDGNVVPLTAPMKIKSSAGDYASGIWSFEGELTLAPVN